MTTARLPLIDDKGNIYLHGQEDLKLVLKFLNEDVSLRSLWMIIEGVGRYQVPLNPGDPTRRIVNVPQTAIANIPVEGANYALRDETEHPYFVRLDGKIRWYGWVK